MSIEITLPPFDDMDDNGNYIGNESSAFHQADTIDGQWLSLVKTEREWQKQKLIEIFGHENAGPRWQYMNGLIDMALRYIELTKEEEQ